jgi:HPt (histidine-containing phosphotransfer) domain-containing protein
MDSLKQLDATIRNMLAEDLPEQLSAALMAIDTKNYLQAKQIVHSIRGSAAFCKLYKLQSAASDLELVLTENRSDHKQVDIFAAAINEIITLINQQKPTEER